MSLPSWAPLPPPTPLGCPRALGWVPWVIQQITISYLFCIVYMFPCYSIIWCTPNSQHLHLLVEGLPSCCPNYLSRPGPVDACQGHSLANSWALQPLCHLRWASLWCDLSHLRSSAVERPELPSRGLGLIYILTWLLSFPVSTFPSPLSENILPIRQFYTNAGCQICLWETSPKAYIATFRIKLLYQGRSHHIVSSNG